uniref:Methyl transferase n=1 Tax=Streptomyces sp. UC 11065 TaxID=428401 RepID=A3R4U1_9ACTN|nr:methyl transferase [Streptomyces sp. UC 11065]
MIFFMDHTKLFFQDVYGSASNFGQARPPWDIGEAQPAFVELTEAGAVKGEVLDAGSGPGWVSLFIASQGHAVTGIDLSADAVEAANAKAADSGVNATFAVGDLLDLSEYRGRFDTVVECGVCHGLGADPGPQYARSLYGATKLGAVAHLLNLSVEGYETAGVRCAELGVPPQALAGFHAVTPEDLRAAFAEGWSEVSITESRMKLRFPGDTGPVELSAWLSTFRHD